MHGAHVTCEFSGNSFAGNFEILFLYNHYAPK